MSEHPLTPYLDEIKRVVTHFSATLGEAAHEEKARVAGMVSNIRPYQTKTGKMMAWVMLEDVAGTIELVLFPRTWEKYQFALEVGGVIIAEGRVDAGSNPPKVLVDNIRTEIKLTEPAQMILQPQHPASDRKPAPHPSKRVAESVPAYQKSPATQSATSALLEPSPPEDPPNWEDSPRAGPTFSLRDLITHEPELTVEEPPVEPLEAPVLQPVEEIPVALAPVLPPSTLIPSAKVNEDRSTPEMLTIILRPTGDAERDIRRISRLYGTLISFPGKDRFAFQIFEEGRGHLIEFPNDTTHLCAEMLVKIKDAVGEENMRVEPILYQ